MVRGSSGPLPGESKGLATQSLVFPPGRFGASLPRLSSAYISHARARRRRLSAHTARWELPLLWARAETCRTASSPSTPSTAKSSVKEKAAAVEVWRSCAKNDNLPETLIGDGLYSYSKATARASQFLQASKRP